MSSIYAYLSFNGNCRQAMTFYQKCLGGKLSFQTVGEYPLSEKLPGKMKKKILYCTLKNHKLVLMGSDMVGDSGLLKGNAVSLMLYCKNELDTRNCYKNLSHGGKQTQPLAINYWKVLIGELTDKYGISWIIQSKKPPN